MATLTLQQVRATPLGKTPTIEELLAIVDHAIDHETAIANLWSAVGVSPPSWPTPTDIRYVLAETGGAPDVYVAAISGATDKSLVEGLTYWLFGCVTNTGASTLDVGSLDGDQPIKKKTPEGISDLNAGDIPNFGAFLYYSLANACWVLINPTPSGINHFVSAAEPTDTDGNDGDFWYVKE